MDVKFLIQKAVDDRDKQLRDIAIKIHANPELAFEEHQAVSWLTSPLREAGFDIEIGIAGLDTAFSASWECRTGGPTIALLAEYDALRGLGHACGHNIIGTAAIGAALALKDVCQNLVGKIVVMGTPGEEGGGGKVIMCDKGVFDNIDVAMLCHPSGRTMVLREGLACIHTTFKYYGKQSHAAAMPELGVSALDAVIHTFVAINSLRQFMKDGVRVHGIITKGGDAPNIVPGYCEAGFLLRAPTLKELNEVKEKVYKSVKYSAEAVGANYKIEEDFIYVDRNNNVALAKIFKDNLQLMGIEVSNPPERGGIGSSDIGNVGHVTATIHPYIKICPEGVSTHSQEFLKASGAEEGMMGLNQAAKALAMTAYDLCNQPEFLNEVREEFINWKNSNEC